MGQEPSRHPGTDLDVRQQRIGNRVVVTLIGSLDLDGVEELAACADRICRSAAEEASFDVAGVAAADDAGVRTLAAAFRCLSSHGVVVEIRGIGGQLRQVLARLGLTLPEAPDHSTRRVAAPTALTPAAARPASAAIGG